LDNLEFNGTPIRDLIILPFDVKDILQRITLKGYKALVVGGCIRDSLLGKKTKDWDVTTNCEFDVLKDIFSDCNPKEIGNHFGILQITINNVSYEIAKFRKDGEYSDNRRPDDVEFVNDFKEDASRRDFTINAMGYDGVELFDYFDGLNDLNKGLIKFVGNPTQRIKEDALRMLRAIRFATINSFILEVNTIRAIKENFNLINNISNERIKDELNKIILSDNVKYGLELLRVSRLIEIVLPELYKCVGFDQNNPYHDKSVYGHIIEVISNTKPILVNRLAALFHDIGKPKCFTVDEKLVGHFYGHEKLSSQIAKEVMTRLKYDKKTIDSVCRIVENHMNKSQIKSKSAIKRLINRVGVENLEGLLDVMRADILGSKPPFDFTSFNELNKNIINILQNNEPTKVSHLAINGRDVMSFGFKGKEVGEVLGKFTDMVIESPDINNRETLLLFLKTLTTKIKIEKESE
jgi:tRNA nucleotidyltransferase (CCA-adding enzyme)